MPEDQKNQTVTRNYIASNRRRRVYDYESLDEEDNSIINSLDAEDETQSTREINKQAATAQRYKQEIPLAFKRSSEN